MVNLLTALAIQNSPESVETRIFQSGGSWSYRITKREICLHQGEGYQSEMDARSNARDFLTGVRGLDLREHMDGLDITQLHEEYLLPVYSLIS